MTFALRLLFAALCAMTLLAGCDGDDADATPTSEATATATATPLASCAADVPRDTQVSERFVCIDWPVEGGTVQQAVAVAGYSAGAFENTIVVQVLDSGGAILATGPAITVAPDLGMVGPWSIVLIVPPQPAGSTGTIHAFADSPRDGAVEFEDAIAITFGG